MVEFILAPKKRDIFHIKIFSDIITVYALAMQENIH